MIKSFRSVGNSVSCVLDNGTMLFSKSLNKDEVETLFTAASGIISLSDDNIVKMFNMANNQSLTTEEKEIAKESEFVKKIVGDYKENDLFEKSGGAFYRKGIKLSIPKSVFKAYTEALDTHGANSVQFKSIDNFWMWCSLNPNAYAREELLDFLDNGGYMLTPNGYFVAYRGVKTKETKDKKLVEFITEGYTKVKGVWKKRPANFIVTEYKGTHKLEKITDEEPMGTKLGNLLEMYKLVQTGGFGTEYTDAHTGKMTIKLGQEVRIDRTSCDESSENDCSRGLHLGNEKFGVGSFGDTIVACLCNPMNVVAVPKYNKNKMRTCAYYPMSVAAKDEDGKLLELDYSSFDEDYFNEEVSRLEMLAKNNNPVELKVNNLTSASDSLISILCNLENVTKIVRGRIV